MRCFVYINVVNEGSVPSIFLKKLLRMKTYKYFFSQYLGVIVHHNLYNIYAKKFKRHLFSMANIVLIISVQISIIFRKKYSNLCL